jgi:hypothetical protein
VRATVSRVPCYRVDWALYRTLSCPPPPPPPILSYLLEQNRLRQSRTEQQQSSHGFHLFNDGSFIMEAYPVRSEHIRSWLISKHDRRPLRPRTRSCSVSLRLRPLHMEQNQLEDLTQRGHHNLRGCRHKPRSGGMTLGKIQRPDERHI